MQSSKCCPLLSFLCFFILPFTWGLTHALSTESGTRTTEIESKIPDQIPWALHDDTGEWNSEFGYPNEDRLLGERPRKASSEFYPLRGKKEDALQKKVMSLFPVRGRRKGMIMIPSRGRKSDDVYPMTEVSSLVADSIPHPVEDQQQRYESLYDKLERKERKVNFHDGIVTGDSLLDNSEEEARAVNISGDLLDGVDKKFNGQMFDGLKEHDTSSTSYRGKRRIFPFITTWRVFQSLQARSKPAEGSKREALFFASRGRRSPNKF